MVRAARLQTFAVLTALAVIGPVRATTAQPSPYNSVGLEWTAPGDDGMVGRAAHYDLRYRTTAIIGTDTLTWWNGATAVSGLPAPSPSGQTDSTRVTDLTQGTTYYFIVRALDEVWNISGYSNVAVGSTDSCNAPAEAPQTFEAALDSTDVVLTWDATGDASATSFHLYRGTGTTGTLTLYHTFPTSQTSYLDASVSPGTTYRYRAAWASSCDEGPPTLTLSVTLPGTAPPTTAVPAKSAVHAYPNPSSGPVELVLTVPGEIPLPVRLRLYDLSGHLIATLVEGTLAPGQHRITWARTARSGNRVTPGYYEALGTIGSVKVRERIVLLP